MAIGEEKNSKHLRQGKNEVGTKEGKNNRERLMYRWLLINDFMHFIVTTGEKKH